MFAQARKRLLAIPRTFRPQLAHDRDESRPDPRLIWWPVTHTRRDRSGRFITISYFLRQKGGEIANPVGADLVTAIIFAEGDRRAEFAQQLHGFARARHFEHLVGPPMLNHGRQ